MGIEILVLRPVALFRDSGKFGPTCHIATYVKDAGAPRGLVCGRKFSDGVFFPVSVSRDAFLSGVPFVAAAADELESAREAFSRGPALKGCRKCHSILEEIGNFWVVSFFGDRDCRGSK